MKPSGVLWRTFAAVVPLTMLLAGFGWVRSDSGAWAGWLQGDMPRTLPRHEPAELPPAVRVVTVNVEYDSAFAAIHGESAEAFIREVFARHNAEWNRYRVEWFELGEIRHHDSGPERDASHVLARFYLRTQEARDTIHVMMVGRPLEVYTSGTKATPIGGLAYRSSDAALVSAHRGASAELVAYYVFHEIGHLYDAYDLPFRGGITTFSRTMSYTFNLDVGNAEIIEESPGPRPRSTPGLAPAVLAQRLDDALTATRDSERQRQLRDLILHEGSPSNPAYQAKKTALLADAGSDAGAITQMLSKYEITPVTRVHEQEFLESVAERYWRAHESIRCGDFETAAAEIRAIQLAYDSTPALRRLRSAAERKVNRLR
jgi:hypothetical protein